MPISIMPPEDDDSALRKALGQTDNQKVSPSPASAPATVESAHKRITVSVRCSPSTRLSMESIAAEIGWSPNKIMTALVENGSSELEAAFANGGVAGAIRFLTRK